MTAPSTDGDGNGNPDPDPDPDTGAGPGPVPDTTAPTTDLIRAGLAAVKNARLKRRRLTFTQLFVITGDAKWTVFAKSAGASAAARRRIAIGKAKRQITTTDRHKVTIQLSKRGARLARRRHTKLALRTVLALTDGRTVKLTKRIRPRR